MILQCEGCQTKFRLDESLLKETGSKVRCSICKRLFTASPPKEEPQIEEASGEELRETEGTALQEIPKEGDLLEGFDESLIKEIEEEIGQEEEEAEPETEQEVEPELEQGVEPELEPEAEPISVEELSQAEPEAIEEEEKVEEAGLDMAMDRAARIEEEVKAQEELERKEVERPSEVEEAFEPRPIIKKRPGSRLLITILLIILVLIVTASALIFFKPGFLPESFPLFKRPLSKEQAFDMGNRRLSFKDLKGSFMDSEKAGRLFMVKGLVTNNYPDRRSFMRIKSNILDSKGTVVRSKVVFAGNPISDKEVASLSMEEIENRLRDKLGKDKMNVNTQPNSSIPFVIVFNNLPEDMSEFTVEAVSSSPAGK